MPPHVETHGSRRYDAGPRRGLRRRRVGRELRPSGRGERPRCLPGTPNRPRRSCRGVRRSRQSTIASRSAYSDHTEASVVTGSDRAVDRGLFEEATQPPRSSQSYTASRRSAGGYAGPLDDHGRGRRESAGQARETTVAAALLARCAFGGDRRDEFALDGPGVVAPAVPCSSFVATSTNIVSTSGSRSCRRV